MFLEQYKEILEFGTLGKALRRLKTRTGVKLSNAFMDKDSVLAVKKARKEAKPNYWEDFANPNRYKKEMNERRKNAADKISSARVNQMDNQHAALFAGSIGLAPAAFGGLGHILSKKQKQKQKEKEEAKKPLNRIKKAVGIKNT